MKQVIQNFKSGKLYVDDVPVPGIAENMVLVENMFSAISAGTERGTVKVGKANLLGKAKQRPDLVAQVFQNIKKEGLQATFTKVKTKLDSLKALGYSTAAVMIMESNPIPSVNDSIAESKFESFRLSAFTESIFSARDTRYWFKSIPNTLHPFALKIWQVIWPINPRPIIQTLSPSFGSAWRTPCNAIAPIVVKLAS